MSQSSSSPGVSPPSSASIQLEDVERRLSSSPSSPSDSDCPPPTCVVDFHASPSSKTITYFVKPHDDRTIGSFPIITADPELDEDGQQLVHVVFGIFDENVQCILLDGLKYEFWSLEKVWCGKVLEVRFTERDSDSESEEVPNKVSAKEVQDEVPVSRKDERACSNSHRFRERSGDLVAIGMLLDFLERLGRFFISSWPLAFILFYVNNWVRALEHYLQPKPRQRHHWMNIY